MEYINKFYGKYRFLSNFYPCKITYYDREYPSVEHAYQAHKTDDENLKEIIRLSKTPGEAKRLGKNAKLKKHWDSVKVLTMLELVRLKFANPELKAKLLETGTKELVEGNTWGDTFWGVCNNVGQNMLGRILMTVREEIKQ